jgi:type IV pilus assembly protein PilV
MGTMKGLPEIKREKGFTLIEVMIALLILSIGLLGMAGLQIAATRSNSFSNQMTIGITLAQDRLEELRNLKYDNAQLGVGSHTDTDNPIRSLGDMGFNRSWTVSEDAANHLKTITVTLQWPDPDNTHRVQFITVKTQ